MVSAVPPHLVPALGITQIKHQQEAPHGKQKTRQEQQHPSAAGQLEMGAGKPGVQFLGQHPFDGKPRLFGWIGRYTIDVHAGPPLLDPFIRDMPCPAQIRGQCLGCTLAEPGFIEDMRLHFGYVNQKEIAGFQYTIDCIIWCTGLAARRIFYQPVPIKTDGKGAFSIL